MKKSDSQTTESERVVGLFFGRDERAISETARLWGALFMRIALNVTSDRTLAEETVNDAYLALWQRIPPDRPRNLQAYGSAVTRNIAVDRVRRERAEKRPETVCELDEAMPSGVVPAPDDGELTRLIESFLKSLDKRSRAAFVIRYFEEESVENAAKRLGMTPGSVKALLHRLRRRLREYLEKEGYGI